VKGLNIVDFSFELDRMADKDKFKKRRENLVDSLEEQGYITDSKVKNAMIKVKRHDFVFREHLENAYSDNPLPIPNGATISAPHMHAIFLSELELEKGERVLEIGAGSGIMLAYMKELVGNKGEVVGVEISPEVYRFAKNNLEKSGYEKKVSLMLGDISKGIGKKKYDKIIVSATSPEVPEILIDNLKLGGTMIVPVGNPIGGQELIVVKNTKKGPMMKSLGSVMFVPLKGAYGWK